MHSRGRAEAPGRRLAQSASANLGGVGHLDPQRHAAALAAVAGALAPRKNGLSEPSGGRTYHQPFEVAYRQVAEQRNLRKLEALFVAADADGSGEMSLDEFRGALRAPWIQRSFSALGVQPHQAEVVFKSMDKENSGELSINTFMTGLTELVGGNLDGIGQELDVATLRPCYRTRAKLLQQRLQQIHQQQTVQRSASVPPSSPTSQSSRSEAIIGGLSALPTSPWPSAPSSPANRDLLAEPGVGQVAPRLSAETRHFANTAAAEALNSPTAAPRAVRCSVLGMPLQLGH